MTYYRSEQKEVEKEIEKKEAGRKKERRGEREKGVKEKEGGRGRRRREGKEIMMRSAGDVGNRERPFSFYHREGERRRRGEIEKEERG